MTNALYQQFMASGDTLWVLSDSKRVFSSKKDLLVPLLEYIQQFSPIYTEVTVFDRIMGNAAALLSINALAKEIRSPKGSQHALNTLKEFNIEYHIDEIVPFIQARDGVNTCPMEEMSVSGSFSPEEFYNEVLQKYKQNGWI